LQVTTILLRKQAIPHKWMDGSTDARKQFIFLPVRVRDGPCVIISKRNKTLIGWQLRVGRLPFTDAAPAGKGKTRFRQFWMSSKWINKILSCILG
jgi:hypothetical protein